MATLTTTDLDNGKIDLETHSTVVNSQTESTTSTRLGDTVRTLKGLQDEYEQDIADFNDTADQVIVDKTAEFDAVISNAEDEAETVINNITYSVGFNIVGDFAVGVTVSNSNDVLKYQNGLYRTSEALPYTTDGAVPDADSGEWISVAEGELSNIARSLNTLDSQVIYATDTAASLDGILYIYDASAQAIWGKPSSVGAGETIVSVIGDQLTTTVATYDLTSVEQITSISGVVTFKNDSFGSAVENMVSGTMEGVTGAVKLRVGNTYSTGGTTWILATDSNPVVIGDFTPIYDVYVSDFGFVGDGVNDETQICNDAISIGVSVVWPYQSKIKTSGPLTLKERCNYNFNSSVVEPDAAFSVINFEEYANGGQWTTVSDLYIDGRTNSVDDTDTNGKGIDVDNYMYNCTFNNVQVRNIYYGHYDNDSLSFQMTFNNYKAIGCRVGFRKRIGTTYTFNCCYTLACNAGWEIINLVSSVMNSHASDGGENYDVDFKYNAMSITLGSELTINGLDLETNTYSNPFLVISDSSVVINSVRLWNTTLNLLGGTNSFIAISDGSRVAINTPVMSDSNVFLGGAGTGVMVSCTDSECYITGQDWSTLDSRGANQDWFLVVANNSYVNVNGVPSDYIVNNNSAITQQKSVTLYTDAAGDDTDGLSVSKGFTSFNALIDHAVSKYSGWDVTIQLDATQSLFYNTFMNLGFRSLIISSRGNNGSTKPVLDISVRADDGFRLSSIYGPRTILIDNVNLRAGITSSLSLSSSGRGLFLAASNAVSQTLDNTSIDIANCDVTFNNDNVQVIETTAFGYNAFTVVGIRSSNFYNGTATTATKYVVGLNGGAANIRDDSTKETGIALTDGVQVATSSFYG